MGDAERFFLTGMKFLDSGDHVNAIMPFQRAINEDPR